MPIIRLIWYMLQRAVHRLRSPLRPPQQKISLRFRSLDYQVAKAAVAQADDVREDRVEEVRKQYESGKYSVSANKLAAKLMEKYSTIAF